MVDKLDMSTLVSTKILLSITYTFFMLETNSIKLKNDNWKMNKSENRIRMSKTDNELTLCTKSQLF